MLSGDKTRGSATFGDGARDTAWRRGACDFSEGGKAFSRVLSASDLFIRLFISYPPVFRREMSSKVYTCKGNKSFFVTLLRTVMKLINQDAAF